MNSAIIALPAAVIQPRSSRYLHAPACDPLGDRFMAAGRAACWRCVPSSRPKDLARAAKRV